MPLDHFLSYQQACENYSVPSRSYSLSLQSQNSSGSVSPGWVGVSARPDFMTLALDQSPRLDLHQASVGFSRSSGFPARSLPPCLPLPRVLTSCDRPLLPPSSSMSISPFHPDQIPAPTFWPVHSEQGSLLKDRPSTCWRGFESQPVSDHPSIPVSHRALLTAEERDDAEIQAQELRAEPDSGDTQGEACPICGDRVSGYHYGLLTCESCKGFFKRTVQNNKRYTCAERQSCPVDLAQRKRCPYCRFQKCLSVGMRREAVRPDRMRGGRNKFGPLYRRDRQLKQRREECLGYRVKLEAPPTQPSHDLHLLPSPTPSPHPPDSFHQLQPAACGMGQSDSFMLLDCSFNRDRAVAPPTLPYAGLYHSNYQSCAQSQSFSHALPLATSPVLPAALPTACLLTDLLQGEPEETQLCARVLASLQREQASRGKHDCLNTFSIMCKMADHTLFALVEWARSSTLFKELKVGDQMSLLHSCWSELLVLDHLYRQVAYGKDDSIYLVTGQQIDVSTVLSQAGTTLSSLVTRSQDMVSKLRTLQMDREEFVCLKYLVLFNPDVKAVQDRGLVERTQEQVNRALMDHALQTHPGHSDTFGQLLLRLPEMRSISLQVEEYLYQRHLQGDLPCNSLLTEMLHAKQP
ncbi:nuclear receptor subfamily 5, group A, member 5 isoform X1 [Conger conger]|uniref:nuclear receptor subfamily 5, group A, member 5 isoform X1 n=1 Tax=Conger conger TaxID=82655 RepID=UPI002A59EE9E|nr:nuclear receptor subfamily 5, group A, member 5 isoform X1 [Conger conger]